MSVALVKIQIRNDTAQAWASANPLLSDGEPGAESNTGRLKIGNGIDRWIDLPYVGGDGSGGGGVNPITGNIDGGIYTGNPRTADAGPPIQPATSYAYVENTRVFVCSWGPASVDDPSTTSIQYYEVQVTQTPTDETSWVFAGFSNGSAEEVKNFAIVNTPQITDPSGSYWYRVKAVLDTGGLGEWGYTPEFRHFREPQNIDFDLTVVPVTNEIGSTSEDNVAVVTVENFSGDYTGAPTWTYPAVTGLVYTEDNAGGNPILRIENTQGILTVEQMLVIQCTYAGNYSETGVDDNSFVVSKSVNIVLKNTSDDPGPGPGPEPTPGDTLPVFNWELVENSAEVPPGLVDFDLKNSWSLEEAVSIASGIMRYPAGFYPAFQSSMYCGDSSDPPRCLPVTWDNDPVCGKEKTATLEFTDFTLMMNCAAGAANPAPTTLDGVEPQYKKLLVAGGASCTTLPIEVNTGSGIVNLEMPNPLYYYIYTDDSFQWRQKAGIYGSYQILDRVTINGVTASYLLLVPQNDNYGDPATTPNPVSHQMTGTLLKTFDDGSTFQYVDVRGIGVTQVNLRDRRNPTEIALEKNKLPWVMLKAKSVSNGREVLVAVFTAAAADGAKQFYYTDDHIVWQPCTNLELLTDTVNMVWTDPATGISYATDATHSGRLDQNGVCSFYKSEPS